MSDSLERCASRLRTLENTPTNNRGFIETRPGELAEVADRLAVLRAQQAEPVERLAQWALSLGFSTGHADTLDGLLGELAENVQELRQRVADLERDKRKLGDMLQLTAQDHDKLLRRVAELEAEVSDLQAANTGLRQQLAVALRLKGE